MAMIMLGGNTDNDNNVIDDKIIIEIMISTDNKKIK